MIRTLMLALAALCVAPIAAAQERQPGEYPLTADSLFIPEIRHGELTGPFEFHSQVFAGTVRRYWIYVPAGYRRRGGEAPNLLVFQDGQRATNPNGPLRLQNVLDNLIARGDIPPTLGVFITPGNLSERYPDDLGMSNPNHRWQEYDQLDDDYARMLIDELLPHVARSYRFTDDPRRRVIGGTSSGAIAAFTVAWHRPDAFANVISLIGSYTAIAAQPSANAGPYAPAGDLYPRLIRHEPIRPLRIFLQDGSNDLSNEHGDWWLANQQMLSALEYANANADANNVPGPRYDINHAWGDGGHSDQHGGALLPDILRWIWRDQAD